MNERPTPSALDLFLGFMNVGLTSVGGAAGPLRHVVVKSRKWMSEVELAELFGLSQALPGATVVNVAIMFGDRCAGALGALAGVVGLCGPALIVAVLLASVATHLSAANPHFAGAELAVTSAVAGIFLSNGTRLIAQLWNDRTLEVGAVLRCARVAISALGIVLVAGFHVWIPYAVVILVACGLVVERSVEARTGRA